MDEMSIRNRNFVHRRHLVYRRKTFPGKNQNPPISSNRRLRGHAPHYAALSMPNSVYGILVSQDQTRV